MKMKVKKYNPARTVVCAILCVVLVLAALLLLWRPVSRLFYRDFYRIASTGARIPGLDEGLVPQGIWRLEDATLIAGSAEGGRAYVYIRGDDGTTRRTALTQKGESITGHVCGLAEADGVLIAAAEDTVYAFSLEDVLSGESADALRALTLTHHASFANADGDIWIGEFHRVPQYVCEHTYTDADGTVTNAVLCRYDREAFLAACRDEGAAVPEPAAMYTLPDMVQGCAVKEGTLVTVSSWGLAPSVYRVYRLPETPAGEMNGVPLYTLDRSTLVKTMRGPLMAEEMACADGRVYTVHESASNKYLIGRIWGYTRLFEMDWDQLIAP